MEQTETQETPAEKPDVTLDEVRALIDHLQDPVIKAYRDGSAMCNTGSGDW